MKKVLLMLVFSVLLIYPIFGLDFETKMEDNSIYLDEKAEFVLTITNDDPEPVTVTVRTPDVKWYIDYEPPLIAYENETNEYSVQILPSRWAQPGAVTVPVIISDGNVEKKVQFVVYIKSFDEDDRTYSPSVELSVKFPEVVDSREINTIEVYMRNRNRLDIEEMNLVIKSSLYDQTKSLSLGPLGETRESLIYEINPLTSPQDDTLEVSLVYKNRTINRDRISYKVEAYSTFVQSTDAIEEVFKVTKEYIVTNNGNVHKVDIVKVPINFIEKLFTKTDPKPSNIYLKYGYMEWNVGLDPQAETKITVVKNFRPMIYVILILIVVFLVYFIYRSPVTINKEALVVGSTESGISELKILFHVRNRSQDLIEQITVTDLIPSLAKLVKESHIGTIAPSKVLKHQKKGTIIKWELDALEPFEERIISYRVKSKIAIVGGFTLPSGKVKFEVNKGKERVVVSNKPQVSLGL